MTTQSTVYISGAIAGLADAESRFDAAAACLTESGYNTVSPYDVSACANACGESATSDMHLWSCYLRHDIKAMLDCDAIAMLPGWERSHGARLELTVAAACGLTVLMLNSLYRVQS